MAVIESIQEARNRGANDEQILQEILKSNPNKASVFDEARKRGANSVQIVDEIIKQSVPAIKKEPKPKGFGERFLEGLSGVGGALAAVATIPETIKATTGRLIGKGFGSLIEGRPELAKEAIREASREIGKIPTEIQRGFGAGILGETNLLTGSKVFKEEGYDVLGEGLGAFAVDVSGDPINLLFLGTARRQVVSAAKDKIPLMQRIGENLFDFIKQPKQKLVKEFQQIGRVFDDVIKQAPKLLGKRLSVYGIKGSVDDIIRQINQRIPGLSTKLGNAAKKSTELISIDDVIAKLDDLANTFKKAGKSSVVKTIQARIKNLKAQAKGGMLTVEETIEIKRVFDELRLTASGALSESRAVEKRIFKVIADSFRNALNKIPEIGDINKELTTYYETIEALANIGAKEMAQGRFPLKFSRLFPYLKLNLGSFAKTRTSIGKALIDISKATEIPIQELKVGFKTILPSAIRNLLD